MPKEWLKEWKYWTVWSSNFRKNHSCCTIISSDNFCRGYSRTVNRTEILIVNYCVCHADLNVSISSKIFWYIIIFFDFPSYVHFLLLRSWSNIKKDLAIFVNSLLANVKYATGYSSVASAYQRKERNIKVLVLSFSYYFIFNSGYCLPQSFSCNGNVFWKIKYLLVFWGKQI